jgi:hypothetical protein
MTGLRDRVAGAVAGAVGDHEEVAGGDARQAGAGAPVAHAAELRGPVPARGVTVSLQAKVGRAYQTFRELRTSSLSRGRLRTVNRFRNTHTTVRDRFRFELLKQAGLPFDTGRSNVAFVLVRP